MTDLPQGFEIESIPEGFEIESMPEDIPATGKRLPGYEMRESPNFFQQERMIPMPVTGQLVNTTVGEAITTPVELGTEALVTGAATAGAVPFVGPAAPLVGSLAGVAAGQTVDLIAQKFGLRESPESNLRDFLIASSLSSVVPGMSMVAKGVGKAKHKVATYLTNKRNAKIMEEADIASRKGGVVKTLGLKESGAQAQAFEDLAESEDWLIKSNLLNGGNVFNPKTGTFVGDNAGLKPNFEDIYQNVQKALGKAPSPNVPSLKDTKDVIIDSLDKAWKSHNGTVKAMKGKAGYEGIEKELLEGAPLDWLKTVSKDIAPFLDEAPSELKTLHKKITDAVSWQRSGDFGVKELSEMITTLNSASRTFKQFDLGKQASATLNPSTLAKYKEANSVLGRIWGEAKQIRNIAIEDIVDAAGLRGKGVDSIVVDNIDEAITNLSKLEVAMSRYRRGQILEGVVNESNKVSVPGINQTSAAVNAVGGYITEPLENVGLKATPEILASREGDAALDAMQRAIRLREGKFTLDALPPMPTTGGMSVGGAVGNVLTIGAIEGAYDAQAEVASTSLEASDRAKEAERAYKISEASNKFNMDLSSFQSLQIENDKIYIDDKNEQQDIMAILMEDIEIPRSHIAKQLSLFNDPRRENELLPLPPLKKISSKEPAVRLTKGGNKPTEYRY